MKRFTIILLLLLSVIIVNAQFFKKKINQFDSEGQRKGEWIEYWDKDEQHISAKGKFENGDPVGKWKYYHYEGKRRLKFKYQKDRIKVKYYHESGRLDHKGWARMEYTEKEIHYFWEGLWKYYSPKGKLVRTALYENGEEKEVLFSHEQDVLSN
ncbi:hypothetical protein ACFLRY_01430 [Bacteroidota bacterium]